MEPSYKYVRERLLKNMPDETPHYIISFPFDFWEAGKANGLWWFRIYGWGLHWKNIRKHPLIFSDRQGMRRLLILGLWQFKILKPTT